MDSSRLSIRSLSRDGPATTERDPLLGRSTHPRRATKSWYRARPLWLVPFAVAAALCRSMTLAPRTEVFTELACMELRRSRHHHTSSLRPLDIPPSALPNLTLDAPAILDVDSIPFVLDNIPTNIEDAPPRDNHEDNGPKGAHGSPPADCLTDPAVQADAAKLQTITTTTMGALSALTTGWWGQFGDRHGRTRVLACAVAGLLFTDIMFTIASRPPALLRGHAHKLLFVAPVVEGLLGGWSTLQGATFAYISDCTSDGSRAHVFSRFSGAFFIGVAFGPEIAALLLRTTHNTSIVFYTAVGCTLLNLILTLFVFPESLSSDARAAASEARRAAREDARGKVGVWRSVKGSVAALFRPLQILGPREGARGRARDWTMTLIATALFCHFLTLGLFQIKYLYAEHMFSWNAEELSYYITAMGSTRALHLLVILPAIIRFFKPPSATAPLPKGKAVPPPAQLHAGVKFDLLVAKVSLGLDLVSQVLVAVVQGTSQGMFVGATAISGLGTGLVPALQSVAMSTMLLRASEGGAGKDTGGAEVGKLFGAISVLQAVGSMILGPMLFGTLYSVTVARFPKAIFVVAAGLLLVAAVALLLARRPRREPVLVRERAEVIVRGRSRKSKDIRPATMLR